MRKLLRSIRQFLSELKRRNVYRVALAYLAAGFVVVELADIAGGTFDLPGWFGPMVWVVVGLGLPIALVLAWALEVTPEGVRVEEPEGAEETAPAPASTTRDLWVGASVLVLLLLGAWWMWGGLGGGGAAEKTENNSPEVDERSIAVLPFEPLSSGEESKTFARGVHDDLLTRLSNVSDLQVISRTSVEKYRDTKLSLPTIADRLGVRWVMEGAVLQADDQIQVNAQLIDPQSDAHVWADDYQRDLSAENLFAIQGDITREIADALQAKLTAGEQRRISGAPTEDLGAYRLYVQGRHVLDRATTEKDVLQALLYFGRALEKDSSFALAWAGFADSQGEWAYPDSLATDSLGLPDVSQGEAARRALKLAPDLAEAHASMGLVHYLNQNGPAALRELHRAVELKPSYATARAQLGAVYMVLGRVESALQHLRKAKELTPQHVVGRHWLADALLQAGQYDEALAETGRYQQLYPEQEVAHLQELRFLHQMGRQEEALRVAKERVPSVENSPPTPWRHAWLLSVHVAAGDTARAREHFDQMRSPQVHPYLEGRAHADLRNRDGAFSAFEEVEEWGPIPTYELRYGHTQGLAALQGDPRYAELIEKINQQWGLNADGSLPENIDVSTNPADP